MIHTTSSSASRVASFSSLSKQSQPGAAPSFSYSHRHRNESDLDHSRPYHNSVLHTSIRKDAGNQRYRDVEGVGKLLSITFNSNNGEWDRVKIHKGTLRRINRLIQICQTEGTHVKIATIVGPSTENSGKSSLLNMLWLPGSDPHLSCLRYATKMDSGSRLPSHAPPLHQVRSTNAYAEALLQNQCTHCLGPCAASKGTLSIDTWISMVTLDDTNEMCLVLDLTGYQSGCWFREAASPEDNLNIAALQPDIVKKHAMRLKLLQVAVGLSSVLLVNVPSIRPTANPENGLGENDYLPSVIQMEEYMRPLLAATIGLDRRSRPEIALPYVQFYLRDCLCKSARLWKHQMENSQNPVIESMMALFDRFSVTILPPLPQPVTAAMKKIAQWNTNLSREMAPIGRSCEEETYDLKFAISSEIKGRHDMERWATLSSRFWTSFSLNSRERMRIPSQALVSTIENVAFGLTCNAPVSDQGLFFVAFVSSRYAPEQSMLGGDQPLSLDLREMVSDAIESQLVDLLPQAVQTFRETLVRRVDRVSLHHRSGNTSTNSDDAIIRSMQGQLRAAGWTDSFPSVVPCVDQSECLLLSDICTDEINRKFRRQAALLLGALLDNREALSVIEELGTSLWSRMLQDRNLLMEVTCKAATKLGELDVPSAVNDLRTAIRPSSMRSGSAVGGFFEEFLSLAKGSAPLSALNLHVASQDISRPRPLQEVTSPEHFRSNGLISMQEK